MTLASYEGPALRDQIARYVPVGCESDQRQDRLNLSDTERRQASNIDAVFDARDAKWRRVVIGQSRELSCDLEYVDITEGESQQRAGLPQTLVPPELSQSCFKHIDGAPVIS
ncbi:hypothetical protein VHAB30_05450 [Variovorax boronicumulans]|nr:hypothetical protein VHAB30_05450 [Variovorax boronicumulans]